MVSTTRNSWEEEYIEKPLTQKDHDLEYKNSMKWYRINKAFVKKWNGKTNVSEKQLKILVKDAEDITKIYRYGNLVLVNFDLCCEELDSELMKYRMNYDDLIN